MISSSRRWWSFPNSLRKAEAWIRDTVISQKKQLQSRGGDPRSRGRHRRVSGTTCQRERHYANSPIHQNALPLGVIDPKSLSFSQIETGRALSTLQVSFALCDEKQKENRRLVFKSGLEAQVEWTILSSLQHMVLREMVPEPIAFFNDDSIEKGHGSGLLAFFKAPTRNESKDEGENVGSGDSKRIYSIADSDSLEDWELFLRTLAKIQVSFASKVDILRTAGCRDDSSIMSDRKALRKMLAHRFVRASYSNFSFPQLGDQEVRSLGEWIQDIPSLLRVIRAAGLPPTAVHGNIHADDILIEEFAPESGRDKRCIINDWSNVVIGNPLLSLYRVFEALRPVQLRTSADTGESLTLPFPAFYHRLLNSYLEPWENYLDARSSNPSTAREYSVRHGSEFRTTEDSLSSVIQCDAISRHAGSRKREREMETHRDYVARACRRAPPISAGMLLACDVVMAGTGLVHDVLLMQQREDMMETLSSNCEGWEHLVAIGESLQILSIMEKPRALKKAVTGSDGSPPKKRTPSPRRKRATPSTSGSNASSSGERATTGRTKEGKKKKKKRKERKFRSLTLTRIMDIQRKMRSASYRMGGANFSWLFAKMDRDHGGTIDVSE